MDTLRSHTLKTARRIQMIDISHQVREAVQASGVRDGLCLVFVPHTTAGLTINENADPSVAVDVEERLGELAPPDHGYRHAEGNADSHIKSTLTGTSLSLIIRGGEVLLGRWQGIWFCEYDGPRSRSYHVKCLPG